MTSALTVSMLPMGEGHEVSGKVVVMRRPCMSWISAFSVCNESMVLDKGGHLLIYCYSAIHNTANFVEHSVIC